MDAVPAPAIVAVLLEIVSTEVFKLVNEKVPATVEVTVSRVKVESP
jgi:hypothetical protein